VAIRRRDLDNARDFGRHITQTTLLQDMGASASFDDVLPIVDVSEQYEIAQAKQVSISGVWQPIANEIRKNPTVLPRLFGAFSSTQTQTNTGVSGINLTTVNTIDIPDGITVVSGHQFTAQASGVYNFQFSAQVSTQNASTNNIEFYLRKNGLDIPNSNTDLAVAGGQKNTVAAWNFYCPLASGDYVQLVWYSSDLNMRLVAVSGLVNPPRPDIPSVIVTMCTV
jgi:hypothetical protein